MHFTTTNETGDQINQFWYRMRMKPDLITVLTENGRLPVFSQKESGRLLGEITKLKAHNDELREERKQHAAEKDAQNERIKLLEAELKEARKKHSLASQHEHKIGKTALYDDNSSLLSPLADMKTSGLETLNSQPNQHSKRQPLPEPAVSTCNCTCSIY